MRPWPKDESMPWWIGVPLLLAAGAFAGWGLVKWWFD